jgi:hypothetical protein
MEMSAATSSASSAAARVLRLPELISAILAHILPSWNSFNISVDEGDGDHDHYEPQDYDADTAADERAAAQASLCAAMLVSRAWYAAGVPLLWRCPSNDALGAAAVTEPARRAFYAAHVRQVRISHPGALWRALVDAAAATSVANADSAERCGGSGGGTAGGPCARCGFPRLQLLDAAALHASVRTLSFSAGTQQLQRYQAELAPVVSGQLEELTCLLTAEVVDRLISLAGQPMRRIGPEVARSAPTACATPEANSALKVPIDAGAIRLRKLTLYGLGSLDLDVDYVLPQRLLAWLAQRPFPTPLLTSFKLRWLRMPSTATVADQAFRHFALRGNITQLQLSDSRFHLPFRVSRAAIEDAMSWTQPGRPAAEYVYCSRTTTYKLIHRPGILLQRPFEQLTSLTVAVSTGRAVAPLALLMPPTLMHLTIAVVDVPVNGTDDADAKAIFDSLSTLQQLQQLQVHLPLHTRFRSGADIVVLSCLTQLRSLRLCLMSDWRATLGDTDLFALLQPLRHLSILSLKVSSCFLSRTALRVIGEASRQLRHLTLWPGRVFYFAPALDTARDDMILFPHLRFLSVSYPGSEVIGR